MQTDIVHPLGGGVLKPVATFVLDESGTAIQQNGPPRLMDGITVYEPGEPPIEVKPEDGERYLRALQYAFMSGNGLRANFH